MAWYSPSPAIPPGLDPSGWRSMIEAVEVEARRLLSARSGVGVSSRLLALRENLRAAGLAADQAAAGAVLLGDYYAPALAKSRALLLAAQQTHGDDAVNELASFLNANGYSVAANPGALAATVARTQAAITSDWERLAAFTRQGVLDGLRGGMVAGANPVTVARQIASVGELSYSRALNIGRTEMRDLYTAARLDYMQGSDVIEGWWWRARPDGCGICQALHGETFDSNEPQLAHHMCRCVMVPHIPGITDPDKPRSASAIEARLPGNWPKGQTRDYWLGQVRALPNDGWRPSYRMVKPGGAGGIVRRPLTPGAVRGQVR